MNTLADLGGRARHMPPPPDGTQFFHFHIHFSRKMPVLEVHTPPPQWVHAPLREILDLPLEYAFFIIQSQLNVMGIVLLPFSVLFSSQHPVCLISADSY